MTPQPNKNKPPLQVLAVAKGNSEKIKVWGEACDDIMINHIKPIYSYKTLRFFSFPISVRFEVCICAQLVIGLSFPHVSLNSNSQMGMSRDHHRIRAAVIKLLGKPLN